MTPHTIIAAYSCSITKSSIFSPTLYFVRMFELRLSSQSAKSALNDSTSFFKWFSCFS